MRILIDPGSHHLLNVGDTSMMQVCVERLLLAHPDARVQILTTAPRLLSDLSPGCEPLDATGRYHWTEEFRPESGRGPFARARMGLHRRRIARSSPPTAEFVDALLGADLLLMSGRGGLTDAFPEETQAVLAELEAAAAIGLPVAMLGQGVGPLEDPVLRARAERALPGVALIAVREGRSAPALLESLGVPSERVVITGDDAIEVAYRARSEQTAGGVGLGLRVAEYSGVSPAESAEIAGAVMATAEHRRTEVVPVPISRHPIEDDLVTIGDLLGDRAAHLSSPAEAPTADQAIAAAARCRVVVAGSYHAAVFTLAQGIPAVGIARTPYYVDKFLGLREQFGDACRVVRLDKDGSARVIAEQLDELWEIAPTVRANLLAAAERQVALSRDAHGRAAALARP